MELIQDTLERQTAFHRRPGEMFRCLESQWNQHLILPMVHALMHAIEKHHDGGAACSLLTRMLKGCAWHNALHFTKWLSMVLTSVMTSCHACVKDTCACAFCLHKPPSLEAECDLKHMQIAHWAHLNTPMCRQDYMC